MLGRGMYLSVFYRLCYVKDESTYFLEEQVLKERDPDMNEEDDIIMYDTRDEHWRDVSEEGKNKEKIHALRW